MSQTHTQRRKSGYYFRKKVPADLKTHFGICEIVRSLNTTSAREASALRYEQGHYWLETLIRARDAIEARNSGRPIDTETLAPLGSTFKANTDRLGLKTSGLHALWAAQKTSTAKTSAEFLSIVRKFEAFVLGEYRTDEAANVKKDHVVAYRNKLINDGLHVRTVRSPGPPWAIQ